MRELAVVISPSQVPCSSSGSSAADASTLSLQVSLINTTSAALILTGSALRFDFPVDPGGDGAGAALVLSDASTDPTVAAPSPVLAVQATAAAGTAWSIEPSTDGQPCSFIALPLPPTTQERPDIIPPEGSLSFVFDNVLVDEVPGVAAVAVTVLPAPPLGAVTTLGPGYVVKTAAGFGITGFSAVPILVLGGATAALTWSTVGAASCELAWYPTGAATLTYGGQALTNPASGLPVQVDGTLPVLAVIEDQAQFTLAVQGDHDISQLVIVDVVRPRINLTPSSLSVIPGQPFTLTWSVVDTNNPPMLNWQSDAAVDVVDVQSGLVINPDVPLEPSGVAQVTIQSPTTFSLGVLGTVAGSQTYVIGTAEVRLLSAQGPDPYHAPLPIGVLGEIVVEVVNATRVQVTGPAGTQVFPAPPAAVEEVVEMALAVVDSNRTADYFIQAQGYVPPGGDYPNQTITAHAQVSLDSLSASPPNVAAGQSTLLSWSSFAATEFILSSNLGPEIGLPAGTTAVYQVPSVPSSTFTVTAQGDAMGGPSPSASVTVNAFKKKEKEHKEKEKEHKEKEIHAKEGMLAQEKQTDKLSVSERLPFTQYRINAPLEHEGTQRAFISPTERPESEAAIPTDAQTDS